MLVPPADLSALARWRAPERVAEHMGGAVGSLPTRRIRLPIDEPPDYARMLATAMAIVCASAVAATVVGVAWILFSTGLEVARQVQP